MVRVARTEQRQLRMRASQPTAPTPTGAHVHADSGAREFSQPETEDRVAGRVQREPGRRLSHLPDSCLPSSSPFFPPYSLPSLSTYYVPGWSTHWLRTHPFLDFAPVQW